MVQSINSKTRTHVFIDWSGRCFAIAGESFTLHQLQNRITVPAESQRHLQAGNQTLTTIHHEDFLLIESAAAETVHEARSHRFWILHKSGAVVGEFGPDYSCNEDYSYRTEYVIKDGTLLEFSGKYNDVAVDRLCTWKVAVICDLSRELAPGDARVLEFRKAYESGPSS